MNCIEVLEYLSAAVDGELDKERREELNAHTAVCRSCRAELEMETMTKRIIGGKLSSTMAPAHVRSSILQSLAAQSAADGSGRNRVWTFVSEFLSGSLLKPALVLGVIVVVVIVGITLLNRQGPVVPQLASGTADMIDDAVAHYSRYLSGKVNLQLASSNPDEVRNFFQDSVQFGVYVPEVKNAQLVGGVLCEHGGAKFISLVYKLNDKIIYLYTGCSTEMKAGGKVGLSAAAQRDLKQSGWHFDTSHTNCSVVVWEEDDEVCSVVADMGKEELLALVKE